MEVSVRMRSSTEKEMEALRKNLMNKGIKSTLSNMGSWKDELNKAKAAAGTKQQLDSTKATVYQTKLEAKYGYDTAELVNKHLSGEIDLFEDDTISEILSRPPMTRTKDDHKQVEHIIKEILLKSDFFRKYPPFVTNLCCHSVQLLKYRPEEYVFREGDNGDEMYVVVSGKAQIVLPMKVFGLEEKKEEKAKPNISFKSVASAIVFEVKAKKMSISEVVAKIKAEKEMEDKAKAAKVAQFTDAKPKSLPKPANGGGSLRRSQSPKDTASRRKASKEASAGKPGSLRHTKSESSKENTAEASKEPTPKPAGPPRITIGPYALFGELNVINGGGRKASVVAYKDSLSCLMIAGTDFRAILHELAMSDKGAGDLKMVMLKSLRCTEGMTDKGAYALAANLAPKTYKLDEFLLPDTMPSVGFIASGSLQVYSFREGVFEDSEVLEIFRDEGVAGLREGVHYEVLGVITKNDVFCEHLLFPELKQDVAFRAISKVEVFEVSPVEFGKYILKENVDKMKEECTERWRKFHRCSVWLNAK